MFVNAIWCETIWYMPELLDVIRVWHVRHDNGWTCYICPTSLKCYVAQRNIPSHSDQFKFLSTSSEHSHIFRVQFRLSTELVRSVSSGLWTATSSFLYASKSFVAFLTQEFRWNIFFSVFFFTFWSEYVDDCLDKEQRHNNTTFTLLKTQRHYIHSWILNSTKTQQQCVTLEC